MSTWYVQLMFTKAEKVQKLKEFFGKTKMDPTVTATTLGKGHDHVSPDLLADTATKLIKINKGEVPPDDRDNLLFSKFLGLEDYVNEHINKDAGKYQAKAKMKMEQRKNLSWLDSGYFSPQLRSIVVGNGLSQAITGTNPMEYQHLSTKVTKMGEGGLPSETAIPEESRQISHSQFGFLDCLAVPENLQIGVTNYLTQGTRKGADNKLYKLVLDNQDVPKWVDHETLLKSIVEIPEH